MVQLIERSIRQSLPQFSTRWKKDHSCFVFFYQFEICNNFAYWILIGLPQPSVDTWKKCYFLSEYFTFQSVPRTAKDTNIFDQGTMCLMFIQDFFFPVIVSLRSGSFNQKERWKERNLTRFVYAFSISLLLSYPGLRCCSTLINKYFIASEFFDCSMLNGKRFNLARLEAPSSERR